MKIHLWSLPNLNSYEYQNYGTNVDSSKDYTLSEWRDEVLDTEKYAHIFCNTSHYFQVKSYSADFFRRELSEAVECLLWEILEQMQTQTKQNK